ncbi:MAG: cytidylate kinase-like family protein [Muribaculaceae bacterium]|nr:cytidylate kinase-like family protein [Muribaculaceae bacterium]
MEKSGNFVVTLGRQFGCGAREIGQLVAKMLGIEYYDKRLLLEAAKSSGVAPAIFEASDERTPKFFSSLWSFNLGYYSGALFVGDQPVKEDNVYQAQSQVMVELAKKGSCVIVGRSADYILRDETQVISIFLHSSMEDRIKRIIKRGDSKTKKEAKEMAIKQNKLRANYYNFYTDKHWGESESYDLSIDSSKLGPEGTAKLIVDYVKTRLQQTK